MTTPRRRLAAAVLAAALAACGTVGPDRGTAADGAAAEDVRVTGPTIPAGAWSGIVTHVSDGDTLWVEVTDRGQGGPALGDEVKLRLLRIDTPELERDGAPAECLAEEARRHLTRLAAEGTEVRAAYDVETQDRFGRDLVHLWTADGTWVNGAMLADGYARVVTFQPNDAYTDEVLAAERSARDAGRGLWSDDAC